MTRREAARAIAAGRVTVDGDTARDGSVRIADGMKIALDGRILPPASKIYLMMNKPEGFITATEDRRRGERVVSELLPDELARRVFPVGRLDRDTTGLLIFTDDGEAAHRALSPRHHVEKSYMFTCSPPLTPEASDAIEKGVDIGERDGKGEVILSKPARVDGDVITITEGKFHQIKRMFHAVGFEIETLRRVAFSGIALDESLMPGEWRYLDGEEIAKFTSGGKNGGD